jgi:hypothetical protein
LLTPDEDAEYEGIAELDRIFTLVNSKLGAHFKWSQSKLEALSNDEQETDVNTATPQKQPNRKKYDFSDLAGKLTLQGDPVEIQTSMRDAW